MVLAILSYRLKRYKSLTQNRGKERSKEFPQPGTDRHMADRDERAADHFGCSVPEHSATAREIMRAILVAGC
jgi:hypothetical protein